MLRSAVVKYALPHLMAAAVVSLSVAAGFIASDYLSETALQARNRVVSRLEGALSHQITWNAIGPSPIRGITVHGLSLSDNVAIARVDVGVDYWSALVRPDEPSSLRITLHEPRIVAEDAASIDELRELFAFVAEYADPERTTQVTIRDGTISVGAGAQRISVAGLRGSLQNEQGIALGSLDGHATFASDSTEGTAPFHVNGQTQVRFQTVQSGIEARIDLTNVAGSHVELADISLHALYHEQRVDLRRVADRFPLDVHVAYAIPEGQVEARIEADGFRVEEAVSFVGPWAAHNELLDAPLNLQLEASYDTETGIPFAEASFQTTIRHHALPAPAPVEAHVSLDGSTVAVRSASLLGDSGMASFRGTYDLANERIDGLISPRNFSWAGSPTLDGDVTVSGIGDDVSLASAVLRVQGIPIHDIAFSVQAGAAYATVNGGGSFSSRPQRQNVERFEASLRVAGANDFSGRLRFRSVRTSDVLSAAQMILGTNGFPGEIGDHHSFDGQMDVSLLDQDLRGRLHYLRSRDREGRVLSSVTASASNNRIVVQDAYAMLGDTHIHGRGFIQIGSAGTVEARGVVDVDSRVYEILASYEEPGLLSVVSPQGIDAEVRLEGGRAAVQLDLAQARLPLVDAAITGRLEGFVFDADDWYLNSNNIVATDIRMPSSGTAEAELVLGIGSSAARVGIVHFKDQAGVLTGTLEARYELFGAAPEVSLDARLVGTDSRESYLIAARAADRAVAADIQFRDGAVGRIVPQAQSGTVSGAIQIVVRDNQPQVRLFAETSGVRIGPSELDASGLAFVNASSIELSDVDIRVDSNRLRVESATLDRRNGRLFADSTIERIEAGQGFTMVVSGQTIPLGPLQGVDLRSLPLRATVDVRAVDVPLTPADTILASYATGTFDLERVDGKTLLSRRDRAWDLSLADDGALQVAASDPLPLRFEAAGTLDQRDIQLNVSGVELDIPALYSNVPDGDLSISGGTVAGTLRVVGSASDPDLYGTLNVRDLAGEWTSSPEPFGPIAATVVVEEKTVRVPRFSAPAFGTNVAVDFQALLGRLAVEQFEAGINFEEGDGIRVAGPLGTLQLDGFARGFATVTGDRSELSVEGLIRISNADMSVDTSGTGSRQQDGSIGRDIRLSVDVETGRAVQFVWPDQTFPILRSSFTTGQTLRLSRSAGDAAPTIEGEIDIQSGDIFYFDRNFLIRDGNVTFSATDDGFDPVLSARAELREVTPDGPVRIFLVAERQRLSGFSPRFESSPTLTGTEIIAILGGNILQQGSSDQISVASALLSTSDVVTQFGVFRQFEDNVREQLNLDLFAIRTSLIQNVLLAAIEPLDDAQVQAEPSLGTYLDNTSIVMGRYIGDSVFGEAVLQLRSRESDPRFESDPGIQRLGGVLIDSEIRLEWQTPLFLLEWNFAPQNPEELFIRDNTFSFSWSYSY